MKKKWYWKLCFAALLIYALFLLLLGENIYISAQDNMELHVLDYHLLKVYHLFFSQDATVPILHGVSRDLFFSEWNIYSLLFMIFPAAYAYEIGLILKSVLGVIGCVLLAKDVLKERFETYECPVILCSLAYSLLPLYPMFSIYFMSLPMVLLILRKIWYTGQKRWYIALFFYPVLSYFVFFGFFILGYLVIVAITQLVRKKKEAIRLFIGTVVLSVGYVVFEYRLFYEMLFVNTDSIRDTFDIDFVSGIHLLGTIQEAFHNSIFHAESLQKWFVMPVCVIALVIIFIKYMKKHSMKEFLKEPLVQIIGLLLLNSIIYGLYFWKPFHQLFETILPVLTGFQFNRTIYFNPFLWYVALCCVAVKLWNRDRIFARVSGKAVSVGICLMAIVVILLSNTRYNDIYHNLYNYAYRMIKGQDSNNLTFREFFSEDLFDEIKSDLNYQGEYAAAYGMEPGILSYNQIATLDGVLSYYPQEYKDQFRAVIAPALDRCEYYRDYYDDWGARAYIFPGQQEQIYSPVRKMEITDENLYIDVEAFKNLDGKYIFSRIKVDNADELGIQLVGEYEKEGLPYRIFVYEAD